MSPDVSPRVFTLVPMQNFDIPWNDQKLFEKYDLNQEGFKSNFALIVDGIGK